MDRCIPEGSATFNDWWGWEKLSLPCHLWAAPQDCGLPAAGPARWAARARSTRKGSRCPPLWAWATHRQWRRTSRLSLSSPGRACSWSAWGRRGRSRRETKALSVLWRHRAREMKRGRQRARRNEKEGLTGVYFSDKPIYFSNFP